MQALHHVAVHGGAIIGRAADKPGALASCRAAGFVPVPEDNGGKVDFYDAEDGPGVQGYEPDGRGVWIVCCEE